MARAKHGVDDMVMLSKISEDAILDNLKKRYNGDLIYTYIGHVLISVNPFKQIPDLYTERKLKDYRGKFRYELPPHVYSLADEMYRKMLSERESQCVIISGESGAGKTEASKLIMQYISAASGNSKEVQRVKDIILESNPLLESFGNAKTVRNNNSSRFGKYMQIQFDAKGDPEGGRISNYLLEKSRIVHRSRDERCFHIFYQLLAGADSRMKQDLCIANPDYFNYLNCSNCYTVNGINDAEDFKETIHAMDVMGITKPEQAEIFKLLMAILYLGNVTFSEDDKESSHVKDQQVVDIVGYLLQIDPGQVSAALTTRTMQTGIEGKSARISTYAVPNSLEGALYSRDALSKALYSRLFDWIISKVNQSMYINDKDALIIGILDIYGFEIFEQNSFEQLCINYVNEKLQQIFIELTLKAEQEEYVNEGIKWTPIDYFNNKICCDLVESKKPIGLLALLDDTCNFPKGTDEGFLAKCREYFSTHAHFALADSMGGSSRFVIKHYAGDVTYDCKGFCDKNKDTLFNNLIDLMQFTSSTLIQTLFPEVRTSADKRRPPTASTQIKLSTAELMAALSACNPHYVRCIKPNANKRANDFDQPLVLHQVRYLGLLENVRIRRAGFAFRQVYSKFFYRYRVCSNQTWPNWTGDHQSGSEAILKSMDLQGNDEYQFGRTKIFIRNPETVFNLEELRERKVYDYACRLQRFFVRWTQKEYYNNLRRQGNQTVYGKKERRRLSINRPYTCDYIQYRDNWELKEIVQSAGGREKFLFAHRINKWDKKSKKHNCVIVVTIEALYIVAVEKNKDKESMATDRKSVV